MKEYNKYGEVVFEGEYLNGKINGISKIYNENGTIIFEGKYLNGKKTVKEKNMITKVD